MAEIGSTLRETRIRNKIDITTVEQATKIRAKYLRALENEEWIVLPGPTYVKTFLRTYAQYLGLDSHLLVEEYSARFEEPEELELPAFSREQPVRTRVQRVGPPSRLLTAVALGVGIIVLLLVLGLTADDQGGKSSSHRARTPAANGKAQSGTTTAKEQPAAPAGRVRLEVVPKRPVWVCVVNARNTPKVRGLTLAAGKQQGPFTSSSFKVTVGNGGGDLRINGKLRDTPDRNHPLGYLIEPSKTTVLAPDKLPTCE